MWFTFAEMLEFYKRGRLFQPVANSFANFAQICMFDQVSRRMVDRMGAGADDHAGELRLGGLPVIAGLPSLADLASHFASTVPNRKPPMAGLLLFPGFHGMKAPAVTSADQLRDLIAAKTTARLCLHVPTSPGLPPDP